MINTIKCGNCSHYHAREKSAGGGKTAKLAIGFCLDRTVFASNAAGNLLYPPFAKTASLPNGISSVVLVRETQTVLTCAASERKR